MKYASRYSSDLSVLCIFGVWTIHELMFWQHINTLFFFKCQGGLQYLNKINHIVPRYIFRIISNSIDAIEADTCIMYDFHNSTDTFKFWTEKWAINKTFFLFHPILMKLGEVVVTHMYYNFTKFHQNRMKNKKVLLIARFSAQNFKVSVELW